MQTPPVTRPFDDAYLLAYSAEHVYYEVDMYFAMEPLFRSSSFAAWLAARPDRVRLNSALVESMAVHARNLIDFLYLDGRDSTDVVAADFVSGTPWATIRPPETMLIKDAKRRANKEIAHLTTQRIPGAPPEKDWDFRGLASDLRLVLKLFVSKADPARLSPRVAAAIP